MTHEEAVDILEMIAEVYPKFEMTRKKAALLLPPLKEMDYKGVLDKLSAHVVKHPYAPTIAEIAAYPPERNLHLEEMSRWHAEAAKVSPEVKARFRDAMLELITEKTKP
ncbi:replicative helicase loader/inhibitor [Lentibacillus saliphilus]|uniref:replicative helicase loader/inhibitor n=1 Tax=Lentibacillus saliphilus TaxID=2737028 RepID=UPI001C2F807E|nr:replicative helicase loader/inhibitor [Lentibacillus saliphilus]